jgi:hypothetical protein
MVINASNVVMIKTYPGGSGFAKNLLFENFRSKASQYGLTINQYWLKALGKPGYEDTSAVQLSNITFR